MVHGLIYHFPSNEKEIASPGLLWIKLQIFSKEFHPIFIYINAGQLDKKQYCPQPCCLWTNSLTWEVIDRFFWGVIKHAVKQWSSWQLSPMGQNWKFTCESLQNPNLSPFYFFLISILSIFPHLPLEKVWGGGVLCNPPSPTHLCHCWKIIDSTTEFWVPLCYERANHRYAVLRPVNFRLVKKFVCTSNQNNINYCLNKLTEIYLKRYN